MMIVVVEGAVARAFGRTTLINWIYGMSSKLRKNLIIR